MKYSQSWLSCNNGDYEFTKAVCNFVNLSFEIRPDHLTPVETRSSNSIQCDVCAARSEPAFPF